MLARGHARKSRKGLALRAGAQHDNAVLRVLVDVEGIDDVLFIDLEVAELAGNAGVGEHRAARHDHLAARCDRGVAHLLEAMDVARERGNEHAALGVGDDIAQEGADCSLAGGVPRAVCVGRVAHQQVDALVCEPGEGRKIGADAIDGSLVELEVTCMQNVAGRALDKRAHGCRDRVVHREELNAELAELYPVARLNFLEVGVLDAVLLEPAGDHAERELRRVDGHLGVEVLQQVRQGADVVLVAVRDDDAAQLVLVLKDIGVIRQDKIHAGMIVIREHETGVVQNHVVTVLDDRHVLADAVEAAQRNDLQRGPLCLSALPFCHIRTFPPLCRQLIQTVPKQNAALQTSQAHPSAPRKQSNV